MTTTKPIRMTFICDQNWDKMTPTANGRFCTVCNHEVYDFTEKSINEINRIRSQHRCGRFNIPPDPTIIAPVCAPKQLRIFAIFSSILLSLSFKSLNAQPPNKHQTEQTDRKNNELSSTDTIYVNCDSTYINETDSLSHNDKPKPFLTTKRKEYYWTKKFPFITKNYRPIRIPTVGMGRYL